MAVPDEVGTEQVGWARGLGRDREIHDRLVISV
jgi:hypothetical protein